MVVNRRLQPCYARDIEVFFKLLKSKFKFSNLKEHNKNNTPNEYNKLYYSILIIIYISSIIDKINDKYIKKTNETLKEKKKNKNETSKKKKKNNYNIKTNKSNLLSGVKLILKDIVDGKINKHILFDMCKTHIIKVNIIKDVNNERKSKTPHSKWYNLKFTNVNFKVRKINLYIN